MRALFDELMRLKADKRLPPVQDWHPDRSGAIDIRIAADGTWYHDGDPIGRQSLIRLFATILRKDPDGYYLVTPAEKLAIAVEDAPFVAVDFEVKGEGAAQQILFVTNVDDYVLADADHPIRMAGTDDNPRPYVLVRDGLEAVISRAAYYRLVELCVAEQDGYWIWSAGARFKLG